MKCFNCGKNFDYEKYYGICPKCGSFNKTETAQEQHQGYHDAYDGGYQHLEHTYSSYEQQENTQETHSYGTFDDFTGSVYARPTEEKKKSGRGSTIFLIVSIVICVLISFGGTSMSVLYSKSQVKKLQMEVVEAPADWEEHVPGETFSFQGMELTVDEAWTLDADWETNPELLEGEKLVAVRLSGKSDGEWADRNQLSNAYIHCDGRFYWQIPAYEFREYTEQYGIRLFERYDLCGAEESEGCLVFCLDESAQEFTLCLEERVDENLIFIQTIHSIDIHLDGGQADEQNH